MWGGQVIIVRAALTVASLALGAALFVVILAKGATKR